MAKKLSIDKTFKIRTQSSAIALFDPSILTHRIADEVSWWQGSYEQLDEVSSGDITIFNVGKSGEYKIKLTSKGLTAVENKNAIQCIEPLGIAIASGRLVAAGAELLPGGGRAVSNLISADKGSIFDLPSGEYNLEVYAIAAKNEPSENLADVILVISRRKKLFPGVDGTPALFSQDNNRYLFQSGDLESDMDFPEVDKFSEYDRREIERHGQEQLADATAKLRNPADYIPNGEFGHQAGFNAHPLLANIPAGEFKLPNEMSMDEILENAGAAPELANSPQLQAALNAQAAPSISNPKPC